MRRLSARAWLRAAFLCSLLLVNPYVRGDGNGYYAWLVSPVIDGDLDFDNQYRHADPFFTPLMFDAGGQPRQKMITATGRLANQWSVGPAMLWSPWFVVAHGFVRVARIWNPGLPADGYSWPYRYACAIGTAVYGWLALLFAWRAAERLGRAAAAPLAILIVWAATPLPVYQYFIPFHVHALAAFGVSWFIWHWLSCRPLQRPAQWWQWGAIAGLMTVIYQLNVILLVIAAYELALLVRREGVRRAAGCALQFSAAGFIVWIPQLVGKAIVYGTPWTTGYGDQFFWLSPRLWQTAFSAEHGLFSWTPIAAVALVGLALLVRQRRDLWPLLVTAGVFFLAVASYQNWHGQSSFGNRFFVGLAILGVIGLAEAWSWIAARGRAARTVGVGLAVVLALWNVGLAFQWGTDIIPNRGPVDFRVAARNQVTIVPAEAMRFLRMYFASRDAAARLLEERDMNDRRQYKLAR